MSASKGQSMICDDLRDGPSFHVLNRCEEASKVLLAAVDSARPDRVDS